MPSAEGSNAIRPHGAAKFDPEHPAGGTLISLVLFLYPRYSTSDMICVCRGHFVRGGPHGCVPTWRASATVGCRGYICGWVTRRVCDDEAEETVEGRTGDDAEGWVSCRR